MIRLYILAAVTVVAVAAASSCDRVPLTSPTGSTISLSIDKNILPVNGQATLIAVVTESAGTSVHNGTVVTFQPSIGRTAPVEAQTVNGQATVTFLAGEVSGTGVIHAFSGAARTGSGNNSAGGVNVSIGSAAVGAVTVSANPQNVPATGGTVTLSVLVLDTAANPLPSVAVNLTSEQGSLGQSTVFSDQNGRASTTLTTSRSTKVTASAGPKTGEVTIGALSAPTVQINCGANVTTAQVGVAVNCTVTPTVATGAGVVSSPIQNVSVNWGDGTGDQQLGAVTGATPVNHTFTGPGNFTIVATAIDQAGQRGQGSISLAVTRVLPTGTLTVPATGITGAPVAMSFAPQPNPPQPITNVTIDFGDGGTRNLGAISGTTGFTRTYANEGTYVVTARVTDASGQVGQATAEIVINRSTAPVITFTQANTGAPPAVIGTPESFTVSATVANGLTLRSLVVVIVNTGQEVYNASGGGTFTTDDVMAGWVLRATATDSANSVSIFELIVQ